MKKNGARGLLAAGMLGLSLFTGCNKPSGGGGGNTIPVGEFASLSGSEAAFGRSSHNGTVLAVEEINAAGGVLGKKLELLTEDDQSKDGESATAVKKLISRDKVVAILGEVASGRSLEAAPICQQFKIPQISPSSTNPKVTQMGDYIFRVCWEDKFQGRQVLAKFALDSLKAKKVALLTDVGSPYSVGLANFFKEGFTAGGGIVCVASAARRIGGMGDGAERRVEHVVLLAYDLGVRPLCGNAECGMQNAE